MFGLIVLGIPSLDTLGQYTLTQLMRKKFPITFRSENGAERCEECYCSPSNDHCEDGEYSVLLQLEHPMLKLEIFVMINAATGEGHITSSRPRGGEVNPWLLLQPSGAMTMPNEPPKVD